MSYDYARTIVISPRDTKIPIDLDLNKVIKLEWSNIKIPDVFDILSNIPNLEDLVCSNSKITKLPDNMLNLINLKCSNNKITKLPDNMPKLTGLNCSNNEITKLSDNMPKLRALNCSKNKIQELPIMPNLIELECVDNKITKLLDVNMPNIEEINCSNNKITNLPNMPNIQILICNNNNITKLPDNMPELEFLNCIKNKITKLPDIPNIQILNCYNNQISDLPNNMSNLKELNCSNNQINEMPVMQNLTKLNCNYNKIEGRLNYMPKLIELKCDYNNLTEITNIDDQNTNNMQELEILHCENNKITKLPDIPIAVELNCSNNPINELSDMPSIQILNCSNTKINKLPDMPELTNLNCDFTPFADIKTAINMYDLPELKIASAKSIISRNIQTILNNKIITNNENYSDDENDITQFVMERIQINEAVLETIDKPINEDDEILVKTYMNEPHPKNYEKTILFYDPAHNKNYIIYKDTLILAKHIAPSDNIFYICPTVNSYNKVDKTRPLLKLTSVGFYGGFLPFEFVEYILSHPNEKYFSIEKTDEFAPSTTNETNLFFPGQVDISSTAHCQDGQDGIIYKLKKINYFINTIGGKKNKKKTKNIFIKKGKRKTRKNQKIKKIN